MSFSLNNPISENSNFPKGVYVDLINIVKAENRDSEYTDCSIYIEGNPVSSNAKYPKKFFLSGNHYKEGTKAVAWGQVTGKNQASNGSWKVQAFLKKAGVEVEENVITEDGQLSDEVLADLIDRKVYILQYDSNGKYSRETWFYFESAEEDGPELLIKKWESKATKPKKYLHADSSEVHNKKLDNLWNKLPQEEEKKTDNGLDFLD